jgi:hypothetical protein
MGGVREARTRKSRLMAMTTNWRDCQRFADAVSAAGGQLPPPLANLLSAHTLLSSPAPTQRPDEAILTACLDGSLTAEKLAKLLPAAAAAAAANTYRQELARSSEHTLLGQFHREMKAGADQVLNSLRSNFDKHAKAIAEAASLFNAESTAEQIIEAGQPELVTAWQTLDGHIQVVARIAAVASQFGCRTAIFPQVQEYHLADNARIDDRALAVTDGPLLRDSALFGRPDQGHRSSPFFRLPLRLHTVAEMQERYDRFAADEWDAQHSGARGGWLDPATGEMHENPVPENPYCTKVST